MERDRLLSAFERSLRHVVDRMNDPKKKGAIIGFVQPGDICATLQLEIGTVINRQLLPYMSDYVRRMSDNVITPQDTTGPERTVIVAAPESRRMYNLKRNCDFGSALVTKDGTVAVAGLGFEEDQAVTFLVGIDCKIATARQTLELARVLDNNFYLELLPTIM